MGVMTTLELSEMTKRNKNSISSHLSIIPVQIYFTTLKLLG